MTKLLPSLRLLRWLSCAGALLVFAFCIVQTLHWKVIWDGAVFHYIRFMMHHGLRPYSDITDMNMPGTYLMEIFGTSLFGWSDLSWRVYEYCLILVLAVTGMLLGGRRYWLTGIYAGLIFMLVRFADGEAFSMERNEVMGMLSLLGMACLFVAVRGRKPFLMAMSSFFICMAASMKPWGYLLEIFLIVLLVVTLHREKTPCGKYLLWALAGNLLVGAIMLGFLYQQHALHGFVFIVTKVWPLFKKITPPQQQALWTRLFPKALVPLTLLAAYAAFRNRAVLSWERWAFFLAMLSGAVAYQLEGWPSGYHRYVFIVFLAAWIGWELSLSMRSPEARDRVISVLGLLLLFGLVTPYYGSIIRKSSHEDDSMEAYGAMLHSDLDKLGGQRLQGRVECLEMLDGCLRGLYEAKLLQNTGSTGDMLLFEPQVQPVVTYYRDWYASRQNANPADVVVLGNFWFQGVRTFDKIDAWPEYAGYLSSHYKMVIERHFGTGNSAAYRIYLRNGSEALAVEQANPLQ